LFAFLYEDYININIVRKDNKILIIQFWEENSKMNHKHQAKQIEQRYYWGKMKEMFGENKLYLLISCQKKCRYYFYQNLISE